MSSQAETRRPIVLLVSIDGLRPDALAAVACPNISGLRARGATTLQATTVMPSITLPCHMTMFRSVPPQRHDVFTNEFAPGAALVPGIADVAHAAGKRTGFFFNWGPLRDLAGPLSVDVALWRNDCETNPDSDAILAAEAARCLRAEPFDFAFFYFGTVDPAGHIYKWMSEGYLAQLARVDEALGVLLAALPEESTVLLTSDHGGHRFAHGSDIPEDMTVPWLIAGPGIRRDHTIASPVSLLDTAPTLARVLGCDPPAQWEGRCVEEAFAP